ncbi:ABC transporter permease [Auraticoccus monumenti]|uniref:ABC-2 type transport system permease protein n=1 Tax=Auraticoccus monumenti TaxID=675864 RepID=A0A1G6ZI42_9ACTN|nr:ABC-2 family transporter protein [Auraticoccus monumenti]SDE01957.1 ABC-2 type transport system permease protein [Auraticoccus monumenti]
MVDTVPAPAGVGGRFAPYRAVLASRIRSQASYRVSFATELGTALLVGLVELAETWVVFSQVTVLGGLTFGAILLVFGLSNICFALADLVLGHLDRLPRYITAGTIDVFYLRPQPVLAQLATSEISLRRLPRIAVGVVVLVWGLVVNDITDPLRATAVIALSLVFGTVVFGALFVTAAGCQFWLVNGAELTNAFTYGASYAATQPASVFPTPLRLTFGYLVPAAFVGYLPTLVLLDLPGPAFLPAWLAWWLPLAAAWSCLVAGLVWRAGVRHYQGAGG